MEFKPAVREQIRLRMALMGATKGGKSYTALKIMTYMVEGERFAAVDTENGRLRLYAPVPGQTADPEKGTFNFDTIELSSYEPKNYIFALDAAKKAGYPGIVIDSWSHAWAGEGGILDQKNRMDAGSSNSYANWAKLTPQQNQLTEALLSYPGHVIVTIRSKMEYAQERDEQTGKLKVRKLGLQPVQRNDVEYEFDVIGMMSNGNMEIMGSRYSGLPEGDVVKKPGEDLARKLTAWLNTGAKPVLSKQEFYDLMLKKGYDAASMKAFVESHPEIDGYGKWDALAALVI